MNMIIQKQFTFLSIFIILFTIGCYAVFAQGDSVTIDMSVYGGSPSYRASGFIYGISEDGSQPPNSRLIDMKARFFRCGGAQLDCPNGGWVNGRYTRRWNTVLAYYNKAQQVGATLIILVHDLWGADAVCNVPRWPGDNGNWTEFNNFMNQVVNDAVAAGMTGSNVRWDLWNEPDIRSFWGRSRSQWLEVFRRAYQIVRAAIPNAIIEGPSTASQPRESNAWFTEFLDMIKRYNVVPDIISWHDLVSGSDPVRDRNNLNSMLSARGISISGCDVNEYGGGAFQNPGDSAWFIARLERCNTDGLRANWAMGTG